MEYSYEYFKASADYLKSIVPYTPEVAIVLGSCLGPFADTIEDPIVVDYADIPNFLISTVASHAGKLIFGTVAGKKVVCMSGRFHSYEGYEFEQLVIPVRLFKLLGVKYTILTNAAGAVNTAYRPGDIMIVSDHIKLTGASPLRGRNIDEFGPRFFDVSRMYTPELRKLALECGEGTGLTLQCLSVMTNMAAGVLDQPLSDGEVDETAKMIAGRFSAYVAKIVSRISEVKL